MLKLRNWGFGWGSRVVAAVLIALSWMRAHASITVLVGEPFGNFGTMMPVGHTAVYLDRVCADSPLKMRMCRPGEAQGAVIARYHQIGELDWMVSPVMEFLYATDAPDKVPAYATLENTWELRQIYRRRYLEAIVPDGTEYDRATNEWWESAGTAYTRRLWGYRLATTREQDEAFVRMMNDRPNRHAYRLSNANCADFAANVVNFFYPGSVKRDKVADFGWMTPKNVARCVEAYGRTHPELRFQVLEIPQVAGSLRRSRPVRGAAEAELKTKRYLLTLLAIQPEVPLVSEILYLKRGRWRIGRDAEIVSPAAFDVSGRTAVAMR